MRPPPAHADLRVGNQTALSAASTMAPLRFALDQGFGAFEWFSDKQGAGHGGSRGWDEDDLDATERDEIRRLGHDHDLLYTVHAPWQANPLVPEGRALLERSVAFARDIGAELVNLHLYMDQGSRAFVRHLTSLLEMAARGPGAGVRLSIENTPLTGPDDFNRTFAHLAALGLDGSRVGMCLDMGHANLYSGTRNDYIRYFDRLTPDLPIIHLHLHENYGDRDSHLPLFTGPAGHDEGGVRALIERLRRRGYRGAAILEQWPQPPTPLLEAARRLNHLWQAAAPAPHRTSHRPTRPPSAADPEPEPAAVRSPRPAQFDTALLTLHRQTSSWRQRLEQIRDLVTAPDFAPDPEPLAALATYLRFLGTGEVACEEDGRHFRPHHHAAAALDIETALAARTAPEQAWLLRKVSPWLPSYDQAFRRSEPLTRIRDIAHRNDIPGDLKREIKQRLQNKLHRCAGPEDLRTSSEFLARIDADADAYSPGFAAEYRRFHQELSEFFNAASLDRRLEALRVRSSPAEIEAIDRFADLKARAGAPLRQLRALIGLRQAIADRLADARATRADLVETNQRLRNADAGLEDYGFTLLSAVANRLDGLRPDLFPALDAALAGVGLSGIETEECAAVRAELRAWGADHATADGPLDRFRALRIKASLERILRLAGDYSDRVLALFPPRVEALGGALGVPEHAIRTFVEGDVRGHGLFPLSRMAEAARTDIAARFGLPPWSTVVRGRARGTLRRAVDLDQLDHPGNGPIIAVLDRAHGEEDIPPRVVGILLAHPIPQLSHLGVRAREAGVPFAAADEATALDPFRALEGGPVDVGIEAEGVSLIPAERTAPTIDPDPGAAPRRPPRGRHADLRQGGKLLRAAAASAALAGAKAAGAAELARLARDSAGLFEAPDGLVLPFGSLELALARDPEAASAYAEALRARQHGADRDQTAALSRLRRIVLGLPAPPGLADAIRDRFGDRLVAVRSSSNAEDLEGLAGAGLYDSVVGIGADRAADAVRRVWASLWTTRATRARATAGIPQSRPHMGVLIQPLVDPELAFFLHTTDPVRADGRHALVELAVGLGETLAAAARPGTPYRLRVPKPGADDDSPLLEACADLSLALRAPDRNSTEVRTERLDYSRVPLSRDPAVGPALARRLGRIAEFLEIRLGAPRDVEGAISADGRIHLLQARPQTARGA